MLTTKGGWALSFEEDLRIPLIYLDDFKTKFPIFLPYKSTAEIKSNKEVKDSTINLNEENVHLDKNLKVKMINVRPLYQGRYVSWQSSMTSVF